MVFDILYRRPSNIPIDRRYVPSPSSKRVRSGWRSGESSETSSLREGYCSPGIPETLSFDRIRRDEPSTPCSLQDFMCYLNFIEHSVENMQFYLWYEDYIKRFDSLSEHEKALSPEYNPDPSVENKTTNHKRSDTQTNLQPNDARQPLINRVGPVPSDYNSIAEKAYAEADNMWQPFSVQPFRDEINQIIALYLVEKAPRELNISARERAQTLQALGQTTHPSSFAAVFRQVDTLLRQHSHPNFITWACGSANMERFTFAQIIFFTMIPTAIVMAVVLTLSKADRWYRLISCIPIYIGVYVMTAACRGLCIILHIRGNRCQWRPWEFASSFEKERDLENKLKFPSDSSELVRVGGTNSPESPDRAAIAPWDEEYLSDYSSDYEDDVRKIPYLRRMFAPTKYTIDPAIRDIQNSITSQSALFAIGACIAWAVLFVPLPSGHLF